MRLPSGGLTLLAAAAWVTVGQSSCFYPEGNYESYQPITEDILTQYLKGFETPSGEGETVIEA